MTETVWTRIAAAISTRTGTPFEPATASDLGGGCINRAVRLTDGRRSYFVKTNDPAAAAMFEAEREGLEALRAPDTLRVPEPVAAGDGGGVAFLVLEYIPLSPLAGPSWTALGERLAALHAVTAPRFGWHRANTIGVTPQHNEWSDDWVGFWRDRRLGFQLEMAASRGLDRAALRDGEALMPRLDQLLAGHEPLPSLLHGDLWGGNVAADADGEPVIFDPAVYYGDREADIAMTEMFGRFDQRFYDAYQAAWPLDPGYARRRTLYNLYHVLNHFNLFGGGYASQAARMIGQLLADGG